jgi:tetratricopeptide (TPR) repeat protein
MQRIMSAEPTNAMQLPTHLGRWLATFIYLLAFLAVLGGEIDLPICQSREAKRAEIIVNSEPSHRSSTWRIMACQPAEYVPTRAYNDEELKELNFGFQLYRRAAEVKEMGQQAYARELATKASNVVANATCQYSVDHAYCINLIAMIDSAEENYDAVETSLEQINVNRAPWPADDKAKYILMSMGGNLASAKRHLGKYTEAEQIYKLLLENLASSRDQHNSGYLRVAFAQLYMDMSPENTTFVNQQIRLGEQLLGDLPESDPMRIACNSARARFLVATGEPEKGAQLLDHCLEIVDTSPNKGLEFAELLVRVSHAHFAAHDVNAAINRMREAAEYREKILGPEHPLVLRTMRQVTRMRMSADDASTRKNSNSLIATCNARLVK